MLLIIEIFYRLFGSSRVGKTTAIYNFLKSDMIDQKFEDVFFCSPSLSNLVEDWEQEFNSKIQYLP